MLKACLRKKTDISSVSRPVDGDFVSTDKFKEGAAHWLNLPANITGLYTVYIAVVRTC